MIPFYLAAREDMTKIGLFGVKVLDLGDGGSDISSCGLTFYAAQETTRGAGIPCPSVCCVVVSPDDRRMGERSSAGSPVCHLASTLAPPPQLALPGHTTRDTGHSLNDPSTSRKISGIPYPDFHILSKVKLGGYIFLICCLLMVCHIHLTC